MKRIPQLDSIRGLAVLVVLLHNTDTSRFTGIVADYGWMGVDLFFVLSGFLITGILLDTKENEHYFRTFYARRCLRIWPLYFASLLFMFVLVPILRPSEAPRIFETRSMPWWSYPLFLQNFFVPVITRATGLLGVTWSLAVEEQFYLVWAVVVRFCTALQLRKMAITLLCLSPILRFYLLQRHFNVYPNTFCRLDGLMAGALLALLLRSKQPTFSAYTKQAWIVLLIAASMAFITAGRVEAVVYSFSSLGSAALVYLALCSKQRWFQAILGNGFLIYTGTISYGIYLLEKIPIDAAQSLHLEKHQLILLLLTALMTYVLAVISWNVLEQPCLRFKRLFVLATADVVPQEQVLANAS